MINALFVEKLPILDKNIPSYSGIAYDGKLIYLISEKCKIISIYDVDFNFIKYIPFKNNYIDLCYDFIENCFWAISSNYKLYKLDYATFCEIDYIDISCSSYENILSIDFSDNNFLMMTQSKFSICNKSGMILNEIIGANNEFNNAICQNDKLIFKISTHMECCISTIKAFDVNYSDEFITCLPKNFIATGSVFCNLNSQNTLFVLSKKNNMYPYILKYAIVNSNDLTTYSEIFIE